jgi:hypothetical protein
MKRIETEEQYQKALKYLTDKAEQLDHPLAVDMPLEEREHIMKVYTVTEREVNRYRHAQYVEWCNQTATSPNSPS